MKSESLSARLLAIRPYSLGNSVILILIGSALAYSDNSFFKLPTLLCLAFAILMQCTANLVNDLCDFKKGADREDRLGPDRAIAKGLLTEKELRRGVVFYTIAACVAGLGLLAWAIQAGTLTYGGWELVITGIVCVIFAFLYTAGPWALAYHGLGDVAVIIFFGLVPVGFTYYIQTGGYTLDVFLASMACGLVIDTMLMLNNFRDREEDVISRKYTVVVLFGHTFGKWAYLMLGVIASLLCLAMLFEGHIWAALLPQIYLVAHLRTWRKMARIDHGAELNTCLSQTARNILMFGMLFAAGIMLG